MLLFTQRVQALEERLGQPSALNDGELQRCGFNVGEVV
jgi:hypothetical protein